MLSTLDDAIDETEELLGNDWDQWAWGDLHVAHFEHQLSSLADEDIDEILNVGPRPMGGTANTPNAQWVGEDFQVTGGASWRMVVDVGEWDHSLAINTPGQSGDQESPFYDDLFDMWINGEYFPLLYSRDAIQRNTVKRIQLTPTGKRDDAHQPNEKRDDDYDEDVHEDLSEEKYGDDRRKEGH